MPSIEQSKANFFDRAKVQKAADAGLRRGISRVLAYVRTTAISSILRHVIRRGFGVHSKVSNREGISPPGQPPYSHSGELAKFIFFAWDQAAKGGVAGAASLNKPGNIGALEHSGTSVVVDKLGRQKPAQFQARPFMHPALDAEIHRLPESLTDCITAR
jgi:hypothetical protein